jgi:hypothetical protein
MELNTRLNALTAMAMTFFARLTVRENARHDRRQPAAR